MIVLRVEYLAGRAVATAFNDRSAPEWPPHPARLYSALVATWAEADGRSEDGRVALEWLEGLPPPTIAASDATRRSAPEVFVPVNDGGVVFDPARARAALASARARSSEARSAWTEAKAAEDPKRTRAAARDLERAEVRVAQAEGELDRALKESVAPVGKPTDEDLTRACRVLPDGRVRQPRRFPSVTPDDGTLHYTWDADPAEFLLHGEALRRLSAQVVRLGHSSSLVACAWVRSGPPPRWVPDDGGGMVLRVVKRGQLARLDAEHERHLGVEPRVLPCRFQRYSGEARSPAAAEIPEPNLGSDWIVLGRSGGPRLPVVRCVDVARSLRGALLAHAEEPIPSVLTGHGPDGGAAESPHAAFVALPFVAHRHADGSLLGVALVLPRDTPPADRKAVLRALGRFEAAHRLEDEEAPGVPLLLGDAGVLEVRRVAPGASTPGTLDPETWCRPATRWLSATPVALDRNPGDLRDADPDRQAAAFQAAEESIRMACVRAGLPAPVRVTIVPSVPWPGAAKARQHPPFPADGPRFQRVKVHAALEFAGPVAGPLLVGAGRYFGLGLFRPCPEGGSRP